MSEFVAMAKLEVALKFTVVSDDLAGQPFNVITKAIAQKPVELFGQ